MRSRRPPPSAAQTGASACSGRRPTGAGTPPAPHGRRPGRGHAHAAVAAARYVGAGSASAAAAGIRNADNGRLLRCDLPAFFFAASFYYCCCSCCPACPTRSCRSYSHPRCLLRGPGARCPSCQRLGRGAPARARVRLPRWLLAAPAIGCVGETAHWPAGCTPSGPCTSHQPAAGRDSQVAGQNGGGAPASPCVRPAPLRLVAAAACAQCRRTPERNSMARCHTRPGGPPCSSNPRWSDACLRRKLHK